MIGKSEIKVLHIIPSMSTSYGGPSAFLLSLHKELRKSNVESTIITTHDFEKESPLEKDENIICFQRDCPRSFYFSRSLAIWIKDNVSNFNIVHIHSAFSFPATVGAYYSRKNRLPYIVRPFGTLDRESLRHHMLRKAVYFELFEKRNLNQASYLHFTSRSEAENIQRLRIKTDYQVIPLGINPEEYSNDGSPAACLDGIRGKKKILFLSRLHSRKKLEFLLDSIKVLARRRKDFILVLAGSGSRKYVHKLERKIKNEKLDEIVMKVGEVRGREKEALFKQCDIFVLPSERESFGISVVEAMFYSMPVIISAGVAINEEIAEAGAGFVLPWDSNKWAGSISRLLDNEEERKNLGNAGHLLVKERFTLKASMEQIIKLYEQALNKREVS